MGRKVDDLSMAVYNPSNFSSGCLEIRLFYVRIAPCAVEALPDHLTLRHLRRELGVSLEINNSRVPATDAAAISLRRDRISKDTSEVTYVSTHTVRVSGAVEFEVYGDENDKGLILCGSLERVDASWANGNGNGLESDARTGWRMECYTAATGFLQRKLGSGFGSPSIEVYIAGCCSGLPVILTKIIQFSPRRKVSKQAMLDAIPEDEEIGKEFRGTNGLAQLRNLQITATDEDDYESDEKTGHSLYSEDMYDGEDEQLTWFNAGVRVGVGIGLGMCVGVGLGVGLLMHSYQATTRSFRRRFF